MGAGAPEVASTRAPDLTVDRRGADGLAAGSRLLQRDTPLRGAGCDPDREPRHSGCRVVARGMGDLHANHAAALADVGAVLGAWASQMPGMHVQRVRRIPRPRLAQAVLADPAHRSLLRLPGLPPGAGTAPVEWRPRVLAVDDRQSPLSRPRARDQCPHRGEPRRLAEQSPEASTVAAQVRV